MKRASIMKVVCVASLSAICAWGLAGCTTQAQGSSGGTAATVNGTEISEDKVTNYIQNFRTQSSLDTEEAWGKWMAENDYTPEKVREEIIGIFADQELVKMGAQEKGITVDDAEVQGYVDKMKGKYDSDEMWQQALSQVGMTEDLYRQNIKDSLSVQKLQDSFASTEEPAESELLEYANMYAKSYDGAKRSSHILFNTGDEAKAQEILDQINDGSLDFAEAAKANSQDPGSAEKGGDVGWDKLSQFVEEYTTALNGLEKDQVSDLVTSEYGTHIIKCTDVFVAPEEVTSLDQIPAEFLDKVKQTVNDKKKSDGYQSWFTEYKEAADIQINPMPENLPYWVDMANYPAPADEGATDGGAEGDAAAGDGSADAAADGSADDAAADGSADAGATDGSPDGADGAGEGADNAGAENGSTDAAAQQPAEQPAEAA